MSTIYAPDVLDRPEADIDSLFALAPMHWVVMHNDPITTMDFVVEMLMKVFGYDADRAVEVMYQIHTTGLAKVGCMPLERAEFKVDLVRRSARAHGYPLTCTIEPD
jgi:ATP-dependent Clp protease adaptor protein ClpS